uniref:Uncharacterized protein n=1 Tax=Panagrolaimus sp. JU765 TaxID=591449 RepID=A0AC34QD89_9BILA
MDNGVLHLMHKCYQQGEPFKQVIHVIRENELDLIPRPHRRSLANYIQTGKEASDLVIERNATTNFIPAAEFESTIAQQDVEMTELPPKTAESENKKPIAEVNTSQMRDLTQDLTADKLALLASKAKQVRAQKGKATERILPIDQEGSDKMDAFDRVIKYKTRHYKTCINILDTNADFSSILTLLNAAKPKENSSSMIPKPPVAPNLQQNSKIVPASGYSRYDQEVFNPSEDPFNIQIGMSFHGKSLKMNNKMDPKPVAEPIAKPMKRPLAYPTTTSSSKSGKRTSRTPIIIVPATGTALITIYNATDILQDLKFVTTEEKKKELMRRENELLI